jgi:hypothetical protein
LIGHATAAGIQLSEFWRMDFAEFLAAFTGWNTSNCPPDGPEPPTLDEHHAMRAEIAAISRRMEQGA